MVLGNKLMLLIVPKADRTTFCDKVYGVPSSTHPFAYVLSLCLCPCLLLSLSDALLGVHVVVSLG